MLLIDCGNTAIKFRVKSGNDRLQDEHVRCGSTVSDIEELIGKVHHILEEKPTEIVFASVRDESFNSMLTTALEDRFRCEVSRAVSQKQTGSLQNGYEVPRLLGVDRWLAMLGAFYSPARQQANCPLVVVDVGTAATFDVVAANGCHQGGYILPGLQLMTEAVYGNTAQVRGDQVWQSSREPGRNTAQAVKHGAVTALLGTLYALLVDNHSDVEDTCDVFLTGGGAEVLRQPFESLFSEYPVRHHWITGLVLDGLEVYRKFNS